MKFSNFVPTISGLISCLAIVTLPDDEIFSFLKLILCLVTGGLFIAYSELKKPNWGVDLGVGIVWFFTAFVQMSILVILFLSKNKI